MCGDEDETQNHLFLNCEHAKEMWNLSLEGQLVGARALNLDGATISVAEAAALKEGLLIARRKGVKKLMVEGDSKLDIKWLASEFQHISWKHIYREANFVVDALAHVGLIVANPHFWDFCLLISTMEAFNFDCMGNGCIRGFKL
ncbi:unnamed protein product [Malus baccata var. baccata]